MAYAFPANSAKVALNTPASNASSYPAVSVG